jgi:hypothetical protein
MEIFNRGETAIITRKKIEEKFFFSYQSDNKIPKKF